jgi:hypothetical protein
MAVVLGGSWKDFSLGIASLFVAARISRAKVILVMVDSKSLVVAFTDL